VSLAGIKDSDLFFNVKSVEHRKHGLRVALDCDILGNIKSAHEYR